MQKRDSTVLSRWLLWTGMLALSASVLLWAREGIDQSHVALTLLLVVIGGSTGGRTLGFTLAIIGFLLIDYFFQPPFGLWSVAKSLDWIVLIAFLAAAFVTTDLVTRVRGQAETARRHNEAARQLSEANRAKDEVLATVSHDLRTPLTTIKLLAQQSTAHGDPTGNEIEEQVDRLSQLVTNVLDLSRIRAGGIVLDFQLNTAEDLIGAAIQRASGVRDGRKVTAVVDLSAPALTARFDFVQTLRIVGNLLDNAIRHSPRGETVEVSATREDRWLTIRVADRGPGVPEKERERIFEAFYRPASEAPDAGHAGLGLSIARRLAELQGGHVGYEARDGGGSVFMVRLPATDLVLPEPEPLAVHGGGGATTGSVGVVPRGFRIERLVNNNDGMR
jgi:two-component system sensor histidine kinase KdpD